MRPNPIVRYQSIIDDEATNKVRACNISAELEQTLNIWNMELSVMRSNNSIGASEGERKRNMWMRRYTMTYYGGTLGYFKRPVLLH